MGVSTIILLRFLKTIFYVTFTVIWTLFTGTPVIAILRLFLVVISASSDACYSGWGVCLLLRFCGVVSIWDRDSRHAEWAVQQHKSASLTLISFHHLIYISYWQTRYVRTSWWIIICFLSWREIHFNPSACSTEYFMIWEEGFVLHLTIPCF